MSFASVNGVSLRYDWRPGNGVPLVLLHEMGGALESWDLVLRALPDRAALRLDLRGFGLSEKPAGPMTMAALAADVAALVDHLRLGPVHLVGGAVGGGVALATADLLGARAARVTALAPATGLAPERQAGALALAERLARDGIRDFLETDMIPSAWPEPRFDRQGEGFAIFRATQLATAPETLARAYRMLAATDLTTALGRLPCPLHIVAGLHDRARPPAMLAALSATVPGARFTPLDSGHFMALQDPGMIAALLA